MKPAFGLLVFAAYVAVGIVIALLLARRRSPAATALTALVCWPLMIPLLRRTVVLPGEGPFADRIAQSLAELRDTLADPAADDVEPPADLEGLVADLHRSDRRLAMVDRLLAHVPAQPEAGVARSVFALRRARTAAAAELEAVLEGIVQLRLQIGLRSLAGNSVPVRERLADLRARLAAVDELAQLELRNDA
jgi:hypothetical protein